MVKNQSAILFCLLASVLTFVQAINVTFDYKYKTVSGAWAKMGVQFYSSTGYSYVADTNTYSMGEDVSLCSKDGIFCIRDTNWNLASGKITLSYANADHTYDKSQFHEIDGGYMQIFDKF